MWQLAKALGTFAARLVGRFCRCADGRHQSLREEHAEGDVVEVPPALALALIKDGSACKRLPTFLDALVHGRCAHETDFRAPHFCKKCGFAMGRA